MATAMPFLCLSLKRLWKHQYANGNPEREEELTENEAYDIEKLLDNLFTHINIGQR